MEFSSAYFHSNRGAFYIIFARKNNLIYINLADDVRVVITIDMLFQDYLLAGYYLLSLCLTENVRNLVYSDEGTWGEQVLCNWCIPSRVIWKLRGFTDYYSNTSGFSSDPREWIFKKSSNKKIDKFFLYLYNNEYYAEHCPYYIMDAYVSFETDIIQDELENLEKETEEMDFTIKTIALLTSKKFHHSLPHDVMRLCF